MRLNESSSFWQEVNPHTVTCDFELALIKEIQGIFPFAKINEICKKGIPVVKDNLKDAINEGDDFQKMITFWNYFEKFWMSSKNLLKHGIFMIIKVTKIY